MTQHRTTRPPTRAVAAAVPPGRHSSRTATATPSDADAADESPRSPAGSDSPPDEPTEGRRGFSAWDAVGILLTAFAMLLVNHILVVEAGLGIGRSGFIRAGTATVGLVAVAGLAVLVARDRPAPADAVRRLVAVWRDPPGDWVAIALGAIVAVPLLRLYAPVLFADSDSARVVAAVIHVPAHGIGFLRETQDHLLPQVLLGPIVAVAGLTGAKLFAIGSVQVLAGVTAYLTRRITGSMWGAAAAAAALAGLPPILERTIYVPMYPTMLTLGYLGSWFAYRTVTEQPPRWRYAVPAGVCLALAPEAHAVGQLFYVVPLFLVVFASRSAWRVWLLGAARIYLTVLVVSLPRIAINLSVGGLDRFPSYRTDYWITKGYVREIQINYWHYTGVNEPLGDYLRDLPDRFVSSLGDWGWLLLALAGVAWLVWCRGRSRWFVLGAVAFMALAVTVKRVPPFPRYYAPLLPGIALLVGVGVGRLARLRPIPPRLVAGACSVALVAVALSNLDDAVARTDRTRVAVEQGPYRDLAAVVDDGKGVIGARSHALLNVTADIPTWGGQFLSEDEYVTYLTWPSDDEVVEVMERHDIGWVLIHADRALETSYHDTWLVPHHGQPARHVDAVAASPRFCQRMELGGFILYQLGPCTDEAAGT